MPRTFGKFRKIAWVALAVAMFGAAVSASFDAAAQGIRAGSPNARFDIAARAVCTDGRPMLQIHNVGEAWPAAAEVRLIDVERGVTIASRKLRLGPNQRASFDLKRIKDAPAEVAIRVEPTWFERGGDVDAAIRCR